MPVIHMHERTELLAWAAQVDGRDKPGHDGEKMML
jgi:hypothetical protein